MIDVIKLARQAGIDVLEVESERASMWPATPEGLAQFAELVQEAERERFAPLMQAVELLLDAGHMDTEHLARLRAAWEAS
jgi:hypothetical protein